MIRIRSTIPGSGNLHTDEEDMKTVKNILSGFLLVTPVLHILQASPQNMPTNAIPPEVLASDLPFTFETNANAEIRWTTYYVSTNEFAAYLHKDFVFESEVPLREDLKDAIKAFFKSDYQNTYTVLRLTSHDEDDIYDIIESAYHRQLLFDTYQEYMEMLTELERMGSYILIRDVDFRRITVKSFENNLLTVEAIWTVHALLHHVTHNHEQQNANCVQFIIEVSNNNELKIRSANIVSIDRFNIYQ